MKKCLICLITVFLVSCASCPRPETAVLRNQLKEHTLIVYKDGKTTFYDERGLQPLLIRLNDGTFKNAFVADRIVGCMFTAALKKYIRRLSPNRQLPFMKNTA